MFWWISLESVLNWNKKSKQKSAIGLYTILLIIHSVWLMFYCCLQGQLCDLRLWFWPSGEMIVICRINENHYKYSDLKAYVSSGCGPLKNQDLVVFMWFSVIHEPPWNDSGTTLSDSQTTLNWFWWFLVNCQLLWMILGQFLVICEPFWNDSGVILDDLQTTLKWFWGNSLTTLKWLWGNSEWFTNYSDI